MDPAGIERLRRASKRTTVFRVVLGVAFLIGVVLMGVSGYLFTVLAGLMIVLQYMWRNPHTDAAQRAFNELLRSRLEARLPGSSFEPDALLLIQTLWNTEMMRAVVYNTVIRARLMGEHEGQKYIVRGVRNPGAGVYSRRREDPFRGAWMIFPDMGNASPRVLVQKKASILLSSDIVKTGDPELDRNHWSRCDDAAVAMRALTPAVRALLVRYFRPLANTCRARFDEGGCQFLIPYRTMLFELEVSSRTSVEKQAQEQVDLVVRFITEAISAVRSGTAS